LITKVNYNDQGGLFFSEHIDILHAICEAAWCSPSDLFEWIPDDPIKDIPEHPLQALKPKELVNIFPDIAKLTPAQLAKLQAEIKKGM
jgi:hypothetical protein